MDQHKRNLWLSFAFIVTLALLLRVWDLGARSLWFDEAFEYWSAVPPFSSLPKTVLSSYQPPLYTFLLHFWLQVSVSVTWLRLLSVLLSLLSLIGVAALSWRVIGGRGALLACILMAVLPSEIRYAQEVGEYALMECLLVWSIYFLYRASQEASYRNLIAWAIFSILAVYSHYGTAIVIIPTFAALLVENIWQRNWVSLRRQVVVGLGSLACVLPLLLLFLPAQLAVQGSQKAASFTNVFSEIKGLVRAAGSTFMFPISGWPFSHLPRLLVVTPIYLLLGLCGLALLVWYRNRFTRLYAWFWISFAFYYGLTRLGKYGYGSYGFRYMMALVPLFVAAVSALPQRVSDFLSGTRIPSVLVRAAKYAAYLLIATLIAISVYSLPNRTVSHATRGDLPWPEIEDVGEGLQYWRENNAANDFLYIYYGAAPASRYYLRIYGLETNQPLPASWYSDCWDGLEKDYCQVGNISYGEWFQTAPIENKITSIQRSLPGSPARFWILFAHMYSNEDIQILNALSEPYTITQRFRGRNTSLFLLEKR